MAATKVLIVLAIASLLLVNEQEIISLQTLSNSWAGQAGFKPGEVFRDRLKSGSEGPEMVVIPSGKFRMGDIQGKYGKNELPVHQVNSQKAFAASKYEITFAEYDDFAKATKRKLPDDEGWGRGRQPVIYVSWEDAIAYAKWLSEQTGKRYKLPTEAEWEYVARAGTETIHWWGNEIKQGLANCVGCGSRWAGKQAAPVGSFKSNQFGLYDTAGNVAERVQDCWHENYEGAPTEGSAWEEKNGGDCGRRVIRGGAWFKTHDLARSSHRFSNRPTRSEFFADDVSFQYGVLATADGRVFQFGFDYLRRSEGDGIFTEWRDCSASPPDICSDADIEAGFRLARGENTAANPPYGLVKDIV